MLKNVSFLLLIFFILSKSLYGQKKVYPYKGGEEVLFKEVESALLLEAKDSARFVFVEIAIKNKIQISISVLGINEGDISYFLIKEFFESRKDNWSIKFLKKNSVVIPLLIPALNPDESFEISCFSISEFAKTVGEKFISKNCFLIRPIYKFKQGIHINKEN
jgi:hypothetical protein